MVFGGGYVFFLLYDDIMVFGRFLQFFEMCVFG